MKRRVRRRRRPLLESLEPRLLLTVSAQEQYFVYRLNWARHDPQQYAIEESLPISLSGVQPRQPLAINGSLDSSAEFKAEEMAQYNYFAHRSSVTGVWPNRLVRDHGYPLPSTLTVGGTTYVFPDDSNSVESLAAGYGSAAAAMDGLIIDAGVNPPGHRYHLLSMNGPYVAANEIGIGHAYRSGTTYGNYWAIHLTSADPEQTFLTGVVHQDANGNQRYDLGEGIGGVTVAAGGRQTTTNSQGGWTLPIEPGEYLVTASGGGFSGPATVPVVVGGENVAVDFISGLATGMVNFELWQNTAPVLDDSGSPTLSPVVRDTTDPPGTSIAALTEGMISDPDPAALVGVAVTGTSGSAAGAWQFSRDGGQNWNALGSLSESAARLLTASDLVRFVPAGGSLGTAVLQFAAWDQTSGSGGGLADLTAGSGGTTAFSAARESATLTVIDANTAPVLDPTASPTLPDMAEDATDPSGIVVRDLLRSAVSDPDPGAVVGMAVTGFAGVNGDWQYRLAGKTDWQAVDDVSSTAARLLRGEDHLRFVPAADVNGTATVRFHAWDQMTGRAGQLASLTGNTGGTTSFSVADDTAAVNVLPVNDAPVLDTSQSLFMSPVAVNQAFDFSGGDTVAQLLGSAVSDVDAAALEGIAVTAVSSNGTMWFRNDGSWRSGSTSASFAWLLKATDKLQFVPNSGFSGTATVTFHAWDQTTGPEHQGIWANLSSADRVGGTTAYSARSITASIVVGDAGEPPRVSAVERLDPTPTSAASVRYRVSFSEDVSNVDASDFRLVTTGSVSASLGSVTADNGAYVVTVEGIRGSGTLELAFATDALNIRDAQGNLLDLSNFSGSPVYTIEETPPTISINDASVQEGDSQTTEANFTVTLSKASSQTVTVSYTTVDNTAGAGSDYQSTNGVLNFPAGVVSRTISVNVVGDEVDEEDETYFVDLSSPTGATLADGRGVGTIRDDDAPVVDPPDGEYRVNTYAADNQQFPDVASNADGATVVVWASKGQNGQTVGVYGQRYAASGEPVGSEFQVNATALTDVSEPRVAIADDGSFIVVWAGWNLPGGSNWDVYGRRFAADGSQLQPEFRVHDGVAGIQANPEVSMAPDGRFVVVWDGTDGTTSSSSREVYARVFSATGAAQGNPVRVNTTTTNHQQTADVSVAGDGRFVVTWKSYQQDGSDEGVFARVFHSDGSPLSGEVAVNQTTADQQRDPVVATDHEGNFTVGWISHNQGGYFTNIYARRFSKTGVAASDEFRVNSHLLGADDGPVDPAIDMRGDGTFVVSWTMPHQDGDTLGVFAQLFDSDGQPLRGEFAVNETTAGRQSHSRAALDARGLLTIVWQNADASGLNRDIFGRQFVTHPPDRLLLQIDRDDVPENGGQNAATITVTRDASDMSQPLVVTLQSDDTSEVTLPVELIIPAGQASAATQLNAIDDDLLDGTRTVTVTASAAGYVAGSDSIDVTDHETLTVAIASDSVSENAGGGAATATVTRGNSDISAALEVTLTTSDDSELLVPATVTIPANQASASFALTAVDDDLLDGAQTVTVTASAAGYVAGSDSIDVTDHETLTISIASDSVSENAGGGAATATVTRSNSDISAVLEVTLTTSDDSELLVPATVTIPPNQASASFALTAVDDDLLDGTQGVMVTASATGYVAGSDTVDVTDHETLTVAIASDAVSENAGGGAVTATVTRSNSDISAALQVTLTTSDASELLVPATVTIPANQASASFALTAVDDDLLDGAQTVIVTASAAGYVSGSDSIDVTDHETLTVAIASDAVSESAGGGAVTATVTRSNSDISAVLEVMLTTSDASELLVPATVTILANQASASFALTAVDDDLLDGAQAVTVTASATGYISGSDSFDVTDHETLTVAITSDAVSESAGGGAVTATVTRSNTDISAALEVTLTTSDASELLVPATLTIPANQASASFALTAVDDDLLDGAQTVTVTASATGYVSGSNSIDVTDHETLTVSIASDAVSESAGGGAVTATVTRSNSDLGAALEVTLTTSDASELLVPATLTIPPNQTSASFALTAVDDDLLDGAQTVIVTASATGYVSGSNSIDVTDHETLTVAITSDAVSESAGGGAATATVTRSNTDISAALEVTLTTSDASELLVPATVTIPANQASASFALTAVDDDLLDGRQAVTVTASAAGYVSVSDSIDVTDRETLTVRLTPMEVEEDAGAAATILRVTRSNTADLSAATEVSLTSDLPGTLTLPAQVTIPASQDSVEVSVTVVDDDVLTGDRSALITAEAAGFVADSASLLIRDNEFRTPWRNPRNPVDVNDDGVIAPNDVLIVINDINSGGSRPLEPPVIGQSPPPPYVDVTGDNQLAPNDVLVVVNVLNLAPAGEGEGESWMLPADPVRLAPSEMEGESAGRSLPAAPSTPPLTIPLAVVESRRVASVPAEAEMSEDGLARWRRRVDVLFEMDGLFDDDDHAHGQTACVPKGPSGSSHIPLR